MPSPIFRDRFNPNVGLGDLGDLSPPPPPPRGLGAAQPGEIHSCQFQPVLQLPASKTPPHNGEKPLYDGENGKEMPWLHLPSPSGMAAPRSATLRTKWGGFGAPSPLTLAGQGTFLGVLPAHRAALDAAPHKIVVVKSGSLVAVHGLWGRGGR